MNKLRTLHSSFLTLSTGDQLAIVQSIRAKRWAKSVKEEEVEEEEQEEEEEDE